MQQLMTAFACFFKKYKIFTCTVCSYIFHPHIIFYPLSHIKATIALEVKRLKCTHHNVYNVYTLQ